MLRSRQTLRFAAPWLILLAAPNLACAADTVFKVGVTMRDFIPAEPYDWRGAKTHALSTVIWYPAAADAREASRRVGPPIVPFFSTGRAARDAAPAAGPRRPLVLLSHGFGGTASDLAWLGGYTVIAVAGGISDPARIQAFCRSPAVDASCAPPAEVSDMRQRSSARLSSDADFQQRYSKAGNAYRDARVRAVLAMAPGPRPVFMPESLGKIPMPVAIVTGSADEIVPPAASAEGRSRTRR